MSQIVRSHFTTQQLPAEQRFAAWQESFASLFDVSLTGCQPLERFHVNLESYLINEQIILGCCQSSAQRFQRGSLRTARDGLDYYMLQTHSKGKQEILRAGKTRMVAAGDLMVIDLADKHAAESSDFANLTLVIPRPLLAPLLEAPDSQEGRILNADNALTRLAVSHIEMLCKVISTLSAAEAESIIKPTTQLMASVLNGSLETVEDGDTSLAQSLLAQTKVNIERNLGNKMQVDDICRITGISRSRLYSLFEPLGGIRNYIQERRLRHCAKDLMSPHLQQQRIYEIAYRWGFSSEAHFSRAFRKRFGMTPTEARQEVFFPSEPQKSNADELIGDRHYEQWVGEVLKM